MRNVASAFALLVFAACSSPQLASQQPSSLAGSAIETAPVKRSTTAGGVQFKVFGSAKAFEQTKGENGIAYDGQGGLWISSPTAFERRDGSNVYVVPNGLQPASANDFWHSTQFLLPLNGYVYAVGFDGPGVPALVRVSSNGSRSVFLVKGLSGPSFGFHAVAAGANALYALWLDNNGSAPIWKLVRISPYGNVLNETAIQTFDAAASFETLAVDGRTGDAYLVQENESYPYGGRVDRYSQNGTLGQTYTYSFSADGIGIAATSATIGPDGNLYVPSVDRFRESGSGCIDVINPTSGSETCHYTPTLASVPMNAAVGADGAIWFVEYSANKLAKITTSGTITEYSEPLPFPLLLAAPPRTATDNQPSGVWFTSFTDYFDSVEATF